MDQKTVEKYYNYLKQTKNYKPTTVAEKLRICMAIGFTMHEHASYHHIFNKGSQLRDSIKQWIKSLSKCISKQRQRHAIIAIKKLPKTPNSIIFLESNNTIKTVKKCIESLKSSFDSVDIKFLTAYAAALLLYGNYQRSSIIIQNLTIQEFQEREHTSDGMTIVSCLNHKTGSQCCAILVIAPATDKILVAYQIYIRDHITPVSGFENLFFLTSSGTMYTQVY